MEDSGREKLQGQTSNNAADDAVKNAENQDANIDFNSAKIGKNKKEEHFKNIEGAEERAKAAERAKEEAKRAAEKAQEKADKIQAKIDETPLQKKARLKKTGIIVGIVAVLLIVASLIVFLQIRNKTKSADEYIQEVYAISDEARSIMSDKHRGAFDDAKNYYREQIKKESNDRKKFYIEMSYVQFLILNGAGTDETINVLNDAESLKINDEDKAYLIEKKCEFGSFYQIEEYITFCELVPREEDDENK